MPYTSLPLCTLYGRPYWGGLRAHGRAEKLGETLRDEKRPTHGLLMCGRPTLKVLLAFVVRLFSSYSGRKS